MSAVYVLYEEWLKMLDNKCILLRAKNNSEKAPVIRYKVSFPPIPSTTITVATAKAIQKKRRTPLTTEM